MQRTWAHVNSRRSYPAAVTDLDGMTEDDFIWQPYTPTAVAARAPFGLSVICTADEHLFLTTSALVYDIAVEAHCPDRVARQFGLRQNFPLPSTNDRVDRASHQ